jgi:hypothetical protein
MARPGQLHHPPGIRPGSTTQNLPGALPSGSKICLWFAGNEYPFLAWIDKLG